MFLLVSGGHICAPERDTNMASPYKALQIWVKRFSEYLAYELLHRPDSWQGFLYIYLLSLPRFQTFCIKRFPFLFPVSHVNENREFPVVSRYFSVIRQQRAFLKQQMFLRSRTSGKLRPVWITGVRCLWREKARF